MFSCLLLCALALILVGAQRGAMEVRANATYPIEPDSNRQRVARQCRDGFDAGDFYSTASGQHRLLRLSNTLAIVLTPQNSELDEFLKLFKEKGLLEHYQAHRISIGGIWMVSAHPETPQSGELRARFRQLPSIQSANPIFIEPETGLARIPTEEILLCLKPQVEPQRFFRERWSQVKPLHGTRDQFILTLAAATAEELLSEANRLAADPLVAWAQPNFISQVVKETSDPLFSQEWWLQNSGSNGALAHADVSAPAAWSNLTANPGIVIAVLDDGVQLDHPDLSASIYSNPGEALNGLDDDANGYLDDLHGWDFFHDDNNPSPLVAGDRHGTAVAGVAAAAGNNSQGLSGVAYGCKIMPLKVMEGDAWAPDSALAEALYYAAGRTRDGQGSWRGSDVICIASSWPQSAVVDSALQWAATNGRNGKGCPIFAAAGDNASRWRPTRIRLPVGALQGPGEYRFGFEYSKDVDTSEGEDLVKIDNVALLSSDGVTQLNSVLGPSGRQDFEGSLFPPFAWEVWASPGAALWQAKTNGALTGTRGTVSAQSGRITNNQWTELVTPLVKLLGAEILSFSCYISSEAGYDGLKVWVYDREGDYLNVLEAPFEAPLYSGNLPVSTTLSYPASNPATIAVGASTDCDVRSDYSQGGPDLDFLAPSSGGWSDIVTTDSLSTNGTTAGSYMRDFGGTSAACPLAAGIAALLFSAQPGLNASDIRSIMRNSCDKIGPLPYDTNGWNAAYGFGRLNARTAVTVAKAIQVLPTFHVELIAPADNSVLPEPARVGIAAAVADPDATVTKVEFFAGTNKIGEATQPLYTMVWEHPPRGHYSLSARASDSRGRIRRSNIAAIHVVPNLVIREGRIIREGAGVFKAAFPVNLTASNDVPVTVDYATESLTAVPGRDYTPATGTLLFPPGMIEQNLLLDVARNSLGRGNWSFAVNLSNPINAGIQEESAIVNSRTVTNLPVVISGTVRIPNGSPSSNPSEKHVQGVTVNLAGDANQHMQTANDGAYSFTLQAGESAVVTPFLGNSTPPANGVTTVDLSLIRRHILQSANLDSPYKLLAADVNASGTITTLDISWIRKLIVDATNTFPGGLWRMIPTDYVFGDPLNPWDVPTSRSYTNLLSDYSGQDFWAIKLGDVNNSWNPPVDSTGVSTPEAVQIKTTPPLQSIGPEVIFQVSRQTSQPGEIIEAHISVGGFRRVNSAQFTLAWDPAVLRFQRTGNYGLEDLSDGNFGTGFAASGKLTFAWDQAVGLTLPDNATLFTVRFKVVGNSSSVSPLSLIDTPTGREVGVDFKPAAFRQQDGEVRAGSTIISHLPPTTGGN